MGVFGMSEAITKAEFARRQGWSPSYVTALAQADRLVLKGQGRKARVLVDESIARIRETADPNRDDVQARHAAERGDKGNGTPPPASDHETATSYSKARATKEHYAAQKARLEYEEIAGTLCRADAVRHAAIDAGTALRASLERLPDQLAPTLATLADEQQIHGLLVEHIEAVLTDMAEALANLGRAAE